MFSGTRVVRTHTSDRAPIPASAVEEWTHRMNAKRKRSRRASADGAKPPRGDRVARAYTQLRELIIWGKLAPGSRIIETDVAERLGVSRTPVRSALQRLVQEGYIVVAENGQQARLSVAPLTLDDARELFAIVSEVEALAGRWAAELPAERRAEVARDLRSHNALMKEATRGEERDPHQVFDIDQAFHRCFLTAGGGPRLRALHHAVKPQSERYVRLYVSALIDQIHESVEQHEAIASAIEQGRPQEAKEAVLRNWHHAGERLSQLITKLGERGAW
jgi:DNA-binding GntR family transcriptional regulator